MIYKKSEKDRSFIKKIDRRFSSAFVLYLLPVLALFIFSNTYIYPLNNNNTLLYLSSIAFIFSFVALVRLCIAFDYYYVKGRRIWLKKFLAFSYLTIFTWSVYLCFVVFETLSSSLGVVLLSMSFVLFTYILISFDPYKNLAVKALALFTFPIILTSLFFHLTSGWHLFQIASLYLLLSYLFVKNRHNEFWNKLEYQYLWEHRAAEKQTSQEDITVRSKDDNQVKLFDFISHGINTPLNHLTGSLSLINDGSLSDEQQKFYEIATNSLDKLNALIADLLDISNVLEGKYVANNEVFDLNKLIWKSIKNNSIHIHEKQIELSCLFDKNVPSRVIGDKEKITKLFDCLINNSILLSKSGEIVIEIFVKQTRKDLVTLRVHISHQGEHLNQKDYENLLKFKSLSADISSDLDQEIILNFMMARAILNGLQGDIGIIPQKGFGNTFWFTINLSVSANIVVNNHWPYEVVETKVLFVDLSPGFNAALLAETKNIGVSWDICNGYDQALQILRRSAREQCAYDYVVMNINYDDQTLLKLSHIIKGDPELKNIKQSLLLPENMRNQQVILRHHAKIPELIFYLKPISPHELIEHLFKQLGIYKKKRLIRRKVNNKSHSLLSNKHQAHRILLVEDNQVNCLVAKGMLKRMNITVFVANNGHQAIQMFKKEKFDLILMDCLMPEKNGYQATKEIRKIEEQSSDDCRTPIIAMTANTNKGEENRCLTYGMDGFIAKPINPNALYDYIKPWLVKDKQRSGVYQSHFHEHSKSNHHHPKLH